MRTFSTTEAKIRFAELVKRAAKGERIVIHRHERPVAALISAAELGRIERSSKKVREVARNLGQDEGLLKRIKLGKAHPAMAAFGMWRNETEFENLTEQIYANRKRQFSRAKVSW